MNTFKHYYATALEKAYTALYGKSDTDVLTSIEYTEPQFGHLTSNIAMRASRQLGKSPMDIAETLADLLQKDKVFTKVSAVAPGFINVSLGDEVFAGVIAGAASDFSKFMRSESEEFSAKNIVMEYSHPNIGKPMGVHHLLSTVIGDAIKRSYREIGATVVADNFIGDLGTQFGKLIHAVKSWGDLEKIELDPITELLKLYVQFHIEAESDVELDDAARVEYKKLEDGDPENRALWQKIIGWSKAEIQPIYDELDVEFDYMNGESFYEKALPGIIDQGVKKDIFVESQGALVYTMKNPDLPPAIVRKKDGATLYLTRDLARIEYWEQTWHPDLMIVVVDMAQSLHFQQVFEVAEAMELTDAQNVHVGFGRMQFADSSMSTRKGNILLLHDLIDEAKKRARELVDSKTKDLTDDEKHELTEVLAIGSLKYNILSQNRQSNITFDWSKMLTFEGNSAPYLVYSTVRARSIAQKAAQQTAEVEQGNSRTQFSDLEKQLALHLSKFPYAVKESLAEYRPNAIANYLYGLAQSYNSFYNTVEFLKASQADRERRLQLNQLFIEIMSSGLQMLGIEIPTKM